MELTTRFRFCTDLNLNTCIADYDATPVALPGKDDYVIIDGKKWFIYMRIWDMKNNIINFVVQDGWGIE